MSETPTQPKTTPARRRRPRSAGRSAAQKAYASENDVANIDPARYDRLPRTPRKADLDSPAGQSTQSTQSTQPASKQQRSRNRTRTKHASASPEPSQVGRQTPPQTATSFKSVAATPAFAGATFHASPAPSALPIPSFLAKPSTDSPNLKARSEVLQEPSPPTDNDVPSPSPFQPSSSLPAARESPLDFMFRAHRREMELQRSHSSVGPRPSVLPTRSPLEPHSLPKPSTLPQAARSRVGNRSSGIESAELDGTPGQPLGPSFATPYHERIKAARSSSARSPSVQDSSRELPDAAPEDPTEALKRFLFSNSAATVPQRGPPAFASERSDPGPRSSSTSAFPTTTASMQGNRHTDIQAMENDLRRILKLDSASESPTPNQRLFS